MKSTQKAATRFEGIGLILILLSFFIQMIETGIEADIREAENYHINKKLDYLWAISSHDYANNHPETDVHFTLNFKSHFEDYKIYSEDKKEINNWQKLVKYEWFTNTRLLLFIFGSILLIIPKFVNIID
jgi:hypothetical protein